MKNTTPTRTGQISEEEKLVLKKKLASPLKKLKIAIWILLSAAVVSGVAIGVGVLRGSIHYLQDYIYVGDYGLLMPLLFAGAFFVLSKRTKAKIKLIDQAVPIEKVSGILSLKFAGSGRFSSYGLYIAWIDDFRLPEVVTITQSDPLKQLKGQELTFEYFPSLRLNRCYYDKSGKGFNFVTCEEMKPW